MRKVFSSNEIEEVIDLLNINILPIWLECLRCSNLPMLQFEACSALSTFISSSSERLSEIFKSEVSPLAVTLLSSTVPKLQQQALGILGNMISDTPRSRNLVFRQGSLSPFLFCIRYDTPLFLLRDVSKVIVHICEHLKSLRPFIRTFRCRYFIKLSWFNKSLHSRGRWSDGNIF